MNKREGLEGLIIFDFDGVLNLNSTQAYYEVYHRTLVDLGINLPFETELARINAKWGAPQAEILKELTGIDYPQPRRAQLIYKDNLKHIFPELVKPVLGAKETLGRLATRYTMAISSSADKEVLVGSVMPSLGIQHELFSEIITADELDDPTKAKPDPYTLNLIMKREGFSPEQTIMVGDSASDVLAAHFSGAEPVVPLTGNLTSDAAKELGVNHIIKDITCLEGIIGRLGLKHAYSVH